MAWVPRSREVAVKSAHALYKSGCVARRKGEHSKARDLFRQAIGVAPTCAEYHHAVGLASMELGEYDEAKANILRAIRLGSRPEFHNSLGNLWKRQGRLAEAIRSYRRAVRQNADLAEAHHNLGDCYRLAGQLERAVDSFRRATEASPSAAESFLALGGALRSSGRMREAIRSFELAWKLAPDDANAGPRAGRRVPGRGKTRRRRGRLRACAELGSRLGLGPVCVLAVRNSPEASSSSLRGPSARRSPEVRGGLKQSTTSVARSSTSDEPMKLSLAFNAAPNRKTPATLRSPARWRR